MSDATHSQFTPSGDDKHWYDLFSRGARDWLRHNDKVREAVRRNLPDLLANADILTGRGKHRVQVPVRFLEHYRFRMAKEGEGQGVGQGQVQPGDILRPGRSRSRGQGKEGSGEGDGGFEFIVELNVDDIVDWLWEELELPHLEPKPGAVEEDDLAREGWDRQGVRARLDRRRTLKEAIKRRAAQPDGPAFTNEDLRYRQLVRRPRPTTQALVFFGLDASSSMTAEDRKLAKTFFFWALQGLRRQYDRIETVFIAHTVEAWEFSEDQFFQATAQGGTVASKAFAKVLEILDARYDPSRYNVYLFYASDGGNYPEDRQAATSTLLQLGRLASFVGYVETAPHGAPGRASETAALFGSLDAHQIANGTYLLSETQDVWDAIRRFFQQQQAA
jgi:uncharacterized sporulation protein YeaH/YhbH (DUF444 family)